MLALIRDFRRQPDANRLIQLLRPDGA
jgi:hypothetical protein